MTQDIPRKGPLGQPTANGGHFASLLNAEAEDGVLHPHCQDPAQENAARADFASLCSKLQAAWPEAISIRVGLEEHDPDSLWIELYDVRGEQIEREPDPGHNMADISQSVMVEAIARFSDREYNLADVPAWGAAAQG